MRLLHRLTVSLWVPLVVLPLINPAQAQSADSPEAQPPSGDSQQAEPAPATPGQPARPARGKRKKDQSQPVLITADQIIHDRDLNTVTASGHVEIDQNGRILLAENLSYNLKQDVIIATGNVSLTDLDGQVNFADYMELTGDMKEAASRGIRVLMVDDSRMAALSGNRVEGNRNILDKGVYTACKPCRDNPDAPPLWQLNAKRITHDEVEHIVEYDDAWLEFEGVPVAYTPYASHADPLLKRKSGLLPPSVLENQAVGTGIRTPYFQVIDPNHDITLTPIFFTSSSGQGLLGATDRWRTDSGEAKTSASVTQQTNGVDGANGDTGWHVDANARFDINDTWRAGWQVQRASDKTYLERYGFRQDQPYLTTHPYLEAFGEKDYGTLSAYSFQSLTEPVYPAGAVLPPKSPVVLPLASYDYVSDPGSKDDYWTFETHTAAITRTEGTSDRRVNTLTGWHLPYTSDGGSVVNLSTAMRTDGYNSDHYSPTQPGQVNGYRAMPSLGLDWRYPMQQVGTTSSQTLTPIVVASMAPPGGTSHIPNEDSLDFELDEINVFSPQPFSGWDRVLGGPRVSYGLQYAVANRGLQVADIALGQAYQVKPENVVAAGTGLDHYFSDYVGRVQVNPSTNFNLGWRYRFDEENLALKRSEVSSNIGPKALQLSTSYVFYERINPTSVFGTRQQISNTLGSQFSHYWSGTLYTTENLGGSAGPVQTGGRITYEDECLMIYGDAGVRHTTSAIFADGHYLMFTVNFKTLSQFPVNVF